MSAPPESSATYQCSFPGCQQVFRRRDYMRRHEAMHSEARPFVCSLCGKGFGRSDVLARHRKKCSGEEPRRRGAQRSPSRSTSPSVQGSETLAPRSPALNMQDEGRLGLLPVSSGWGERRKRKHPEKSRQSSVSSAGSEDLIDGSGDLSGAPSRARAGRKRDVPQTMPILDIDFPKQSLHPPLSAGGMSYAAEPSNPMGHLPPADGFDPLGGYSYGTWGGQGFDGLQFDNLVGLPQLESYLPDTTFDFEAFFSAKGDSDEGPGAALNAQPNGIATSVAGTTSSAATNLANRIGLAPDTNSPLYVPASRFQAYYQLPHWSLPPLIELTSYADHTRRLILPHFDMIHQPTFRLEMHATCLAFTMCLIGAVDKGDGGSDFALGVRNEMTTVLMRSFSVSKRMTMSDYNLALSQSLFLLQSPELLSDHAHERMRANMFRTTVVNTSRQLEAFNKNGSHARRDIRLPSEPWTYFELDLYWRRWVQVETRRRATCLVYLFDTLATIETGISCICSPVEVGFLPLPAPASLWKAETAEGWLTAAKAASPVTLDMALRALFTTGDRKVNEGLVANYMDDFALCIVLITILRGVFDVGEGRRENGNWHDLTDLWLSREDADDLVAELGEERVTRAKILERYTTAVAKWRQWWDDREPKRIQERLAYPNSRTPLCQEALPVYWLVQALLNIIVTASSPMESRRAFVSRINFAEMLSAARSFTRTEQGQGQGNVGAMMPPYTAPIVGGVNGNGNGNGNGVGR